MMDDRKTSKREQFKPDSISKDGTKTYVVEGKLESFSFKLEFWSRIKALFGHGIVVSFDPPITGHSITVGKTR